MARLTRAERQAGTRASILAAARVRFLRDGYAVTSLDQIAEDAGFSKGAVYSNFRDKPNLCREVLLGIHAEKLAEVSSIATAPGEVDDLLIALGDWLEKTVGDVGWTMLEMEFAVLSRNNPGQTQMITSLHEGMHATVVDAVRAVATRIGIGGFDDPAQSTKLSEMADVVVATTFGLGVQRAVDPSISIAPAIYAIRGALASLGAANDTVTTTSPEAS
jgi:AcrR family transcriptional regulator